MSIRCLSFLQYSRMMGVSFLRCKKSLLLAYAVIALVVSIPVTANPATATDSLVKKLRQLETFSGQFQQMLVDANGDTLQASSGDFLLKRPGYFRWETKDPFPQLLVSNLKNIWLYDPDLEQVTVREYGENVSQTPALLLGGDVDNIATHYMVEQINEQTYHLLPRLPQELFKQLIVSFVDAQLRDMTLLDSLGQQTRFTFVNGIYNQAIDDHVFEFTPPSGTDIVLGR